MSNIWLDFDPLAHNKPKAAAPVTSLEQAEVRPSNNAHSRDGSLSTLDAAQQPDSKVTGKLARPPSVGLNSKEPTSSGPSSYPNPIEEHQGPDEERPGSEAAPPKNAEDLDEGPTSTGAASITESLRSKTEAGPSQWPPKLIVSDSREAESEHTGEPQPHTGELRKNSIAALKELGDPMSSTTKEGAPEEDDLVASFDFQKFMDSLRAKSATPIAKYIKSFLQEFARGVWTPTQQEKIVADFLRFIYVKLRDYEPFASMSKRERRNSLEGVEKLVMTRLYTRTFSPKMPPILRTDGHNEDLLRDQVFEEKLRLWGWLEGRHLDINEEYLKSSFTQLATTELGRLHQFKSPRDKVICILNCSKVIYALIRQARLEQNADSFLPLLIYVVLMAHPVHLVSTINYIQRFRAKEFQRGETAYYLSTLASAVAFLESLDKASLTISDEEYEQRMTDSVRAESNRRTQQQGQHEYTHDEELRLHEGESSAAVLTASAGMLVDRMRKFTTKIIEDFAAPEGEETQANYGNTPATSQASRESRSRGYASQERAAKEASREEYLQEQAQRQQFDETLVTLQNMFPTLDKDLIEDVLHENGTNVGSAVDICLTLSG